MLNYDENDGQFDHVAPPLPESGTPLQNRKCKFCGIPHGESLWEIPLKSQSSVDGMTDSPYAING
jgi:hypothetical protein